MDDKLEPGIWSVIANIRRVMPYGPGGVASRSGVRKFKAGAKVHIVGGFPGAQTAIIAIGQHRHDGRYLRCIIGPDQIETLRVKMVYSPSVLALMEDLPDGAAFFTTRDEAQRFAEQLPHWGVRQQDRLPRPDTAPS